MRVALFIAFILITACSRQVQQSRSHYESHDSIITYNSGNIDIPERTDSFDVDVSDLCQQLQLENDSLRMVTNNNAGSAPELVRHKPGASVSIIPKKDLPGHATIVCHEDEWRRKYDSLYKQVQIVTVVRDTVISVQNVCTSKFHGFTVYWFYGTAGLLIIVFGLSYFKKIL